MEKSELKALLAEINEKKSKFYRGLCGLIIDKYGPSKKVNLNEEQELFFDHFKGTLMPVRAVKIRNGELYIESQTSCGEWTWHHHEDDGETLLGDLLDYL